MTSQQSSQRGWERIDDEQCRLAADVIELVGRRWSSGILFAIARGADRFGYILASVTGLSDRMLAVRLKELQRDGLISRLVEPTTPVSVRYQLTPRGGELLGLLNPLVQHARRWSTADVTD